MRMRKTLNSINMMTNEGECGEGEGNTHKVLLQRATIMC
jgi:hypothetical protein